MAIEVIIFIMQTEKGKCNHKSLGRAKRAKSVVRPASVLIAKNTNHLFSGKPR
jgi:hypothetical protein